MLSRNAQGLYWMSRYLERTEFLCRLLRLQTESLVDRPVRDIHAGWRRLYMSLNRLPPGGSLDIGIEESDEYTLADSYTLAGDLTFDRVNPDSVWNCFAQGRENARQMRHRISSEMWQRLNLVYLRIRSLDIQDIWVSSPEAFYTEMGADIGAFSGAAETTMYRDEGWSFLQIGRFIERAQFSAELIVQQIAIDVEAGEYREGDWLDLLRVSNALEQYNRRYGISVYPGDVMDLLVTDPMLPSSLSRSFRAIELELDSIGAGPGADSFGATRRMAGRLSALVQYEWPDNLDREDLLNRALEQSRELHSLINSAYFDYPVAGVT